jgi:hypothetical protein
LCVFEKNKRFKAYFLKAKKAFHSQNYKFRKTGHGSGAVELACQRLISIKNDRKTLGNEDLSAASRKCTQNCKKTRSPISVTGRFGQKNRPTK